MPARLVRRTYLTLPSRESLRAGARTPDLAGVTLARRAPCGVQEYRDLYHLVGEGYEWTSRDAWSDERLGAWLARADVQVWVLEAEGAPAGYFELQRHADGRAEIVYFGLARRVHGRGLGAWMLERAVERAWALDDPTCVCLNTCSDDAPQALPNYLRRGFRPYRTEEYVAV